MSWFSWFWFRQAATQPQPQLPPQQPQLPPPPPPLTAEQIHIQKLEKELDFQRYNKMNPAEYSAKYRDMEQVLNAVYWHPMNGTLAPDAPHDPRRCMKLLFVGQAGAGKGTTICNIEQVFMRMQSFIAPYGVSRDGTYTRSVAHLNLRRQPPTVDPHGMGAAEHLQQSQLVIIDCPGDEASRQLALTALIRGKLQHGHQTRLCAEQGVQLDDDATHYSAAPTITEQPHGVVVVINAVTAFDHMHIASNNALLDQVHQACNSASNHFRPTVHIILTHVREAAGIAPDQQWNYHDEAVRHVCAMACHHFRCDLGSIFPVENMTAYYDRGFDPRMTAVLIAISSIVLRTADAICSAHSAAVPPPG